MSTSRSIFLLITFLLFTQISFAQGIYEVKGSNDPKLIRSRGLEMLGEIKQIIKKYYYDKNYRGINLDERFKSAEAKIKNLNTNAEVFRAIAEIVMGFNDSHTRFVPPNRENRVRYGFSMQMIGNECFVVNVEKGSDAEKKGMKVGDIVTKLGSYSPNRDNLWKLEYIIYSLQPQEKLSMRLLKPDNTETSLEILSSFKSLKDREAEAKKRKKKDKDSESLYHCQKASDELIACRLETFSVEKKDIDKMMAEAKSYKNLILDLRGNSGGYVFIEEYLTGHFFDHDVKIANFITRDKNEERIAKTQKDKVFKGNLIVLVDSESASASEVFSRVIQLEKRGKVVGDVSAGAVMTSYFMNLSTSRGPWEIQTVSFYGLNITVADLIMSDGNRLENIGVIPDHPVGPTGDALYNKSDPVLSYSAGLLGVKISPEDAGKFKFLAVKTEDEEDEEEN